MIHLPFSFALEGHEKDKHSKGLDLLRYNSYGGGRNISQIDRND